VAVGAILLVLFLRLERSIASRGGMPLVDPAMLEDRPFLRGLATVFAFQFGNIAFYLLITLILQGSLGLPPLRAGLVIAPLALTFTLAARLSGVWLARYGTRVLLAGCLIQFLSLLGLGAILNWPPSGMLAPIAIVLLGFGFGQGLVMAPLSGLVLATVRPTHAGSGAGVLNTVHQAAGATGVSTIGIFAFQGQFIAAIALLAVALAVTFLLLVDREAVRGKRLRPMVQAAPRSGALSTPRLRAIGSRVK
jgi:predicted MFS family arabinose efflux permease